MSLKSLALARCPALRLSAPGNATVASARVLLHTGQGRRMRVFKCGPDFLDPHWRRLVSYAPVHPLHTWPASSPAAVAALCTAHTP